MLIPAIKLAPKLQALPELASCEIHAATLTDAHLGRTIAVQTEGAVIAGPLTGLSQSQLVGGTRLLLRIRTNSTIGDLTLGVHPAHPVTVLPDHHTLTLTITAR